MINIESWLKKKKNRQMLFFLIGVIMLYFYNKNRNKVTTGGFSDLRTGGSGLVTGTPPKPTDNTGGAIPERAVNADGAIGTYKTVVDDRTFYYSRSPEFSLSFAGGKLTDNTPGLSWNGTCMQTAQGWNRFYMFGDSVLENADGSYCKLENLDLPDENYTIFAEDCKPDKIHNIQEFRDKLGGWGADAVNIDNAKRSDIYLSIRSTTKRGVGITPKWNIPSMALIFPSALQPKDWQPYGKYFATGIQNVGDSPESYHALGVLTDMKIGNNNPQPSTFITYKKPDSSPISTAALYDLGKHLAMRLGYSPRSILTDEIAENMQNQDPDIYGKLASLYKGYFDALKERGINDKRKMGGDGPYGGDDYYKYLYQGIMSAPRNDYERWLTDRVFHTYDSNGWRGGNSNPEINEFFTRDHVLYRNANLDLYQSQRNGDIVPWLLTANERVKLSTRTWQNNVANECNLIGYSMARRQSLVQLPNSNPELPPRNVGIEYGSTGQIIPFPGGEILSVNNLTVPAPWEETFVNTFFMGLFCNGMVLWDAPNTLIGKDPTKFSFNFDQPVYWTPNGGNKGAYIVGQNGAPGTSANALVDRLYAAPTDASEAAQDVLWSVRDRIQEVSHAPYTSDRGGFTPTPGEAGHHLNGFGPTNFRQFTGRDTAQAKKGFMFKCGGSGGGMMVYRNGYLSRHLSEEVSSFGMNFGRVFGGQIAIKFF